jgi:hypothetical protein
MLAPAYAIDIGDPVYKGDVKGNVRVEVIYESFDRDVTFTDYKVNATGPGGTVSEEVDDVDTSTEADVLLLRVSFLSSEKAAIYVDGGTFDDDTAEDQPLLLGVGGRLLAFKQGAARINIVASGHMAPSYDVSDEDVDEELGREIAEGEIEFFEASAGALISGDVALDAKTKFIPYGGLLFSVFRGEFDADFEFPDVNVTASSSADIEEDDPLVAVLGASFVFQENLSIRIEGRVIGDESISGAIGAAF